MFIKRRRFQMNNLLCPNQLLAQAMIWCSLFIPLMVAKLNKTPDLEHYFTNNTNECKVQNQRNLFKAYIGFPAGDISPHIVVLWQLCDLNVHSFETCLEIISFHSKTVQWAPFWLKQTYTHTPKSSSQTFTKKRILYEIQCILYIFPSPKTMQT